MDVNNSQQSNPIRITLDELFKEVFPGLSHWIEKIHIAKEETITPEKRPANK